MGSWYNIFIFIKKEYVITFLLLNIQKLNLITLLIKAHKLDV